MSPPANAPSRIPFACAIAALALALSGCDAPPAAPSTPQPPAMTTVPPAMRVAPLAVPPPDTPDEDPIQANAPSNMEASILHLGRLIISLERTAMSDVKNQIGAGEFDEQGDGGDWRQWLCYTAPNQRVWLMSTQTGSGEFITSFVVSKEANAEPSEHCPALPAAYTPIVLEPDIRLGSPATSITRRYGQPQNQDGWSTYRSMLSSNHDSLHFDETHWLALRYENGVVTGMAARKLSQAASPN